MAISDRLSSPKVSIAVSYPFLAFFGSEIFQGRELTVSIPLSYSHNTLLLFSTI